MTSFPALYFLFLSIHIATGSSAPNETQCNSGAVRLTGLSSSQAGRFEMCEDGEWGTVCDAYGNWSLRNSYVTCNMLGYKYAVLTDFPAERLDYESGVVPNILFHSVHCLGFESSINECDRAMDTLSCDHSHDVVIFCSDAREGDIRLVGPGEAGGTIEVFDDFYGWSSVCTTEWDNNDANVACKQLGFDGGESNITRYFTSQLAFKRFNNYKCTGEEATLSDCQHDGPFPGGCTTTAYAGVICTTKNNYALLAMVLIPIVSLLAISLIILISVYCLLKMRRKAKAQSSIESSLPHTQILRDTWQYIAGPAPPTYAEACVQESNSTASEDTGENDSSHDTIMISTVHEEESTDLNNASTSDAHALHVTNN